MSEKELETLRRKYSVARHQISLLYKDYLEEGNVWKKEKEQLQANIKKLGEQINLDSLKLQEYDVFINKNFYLIRELKFLIRFALIENRDFWTRWTKMNQF